MDKERYEEFAAVFKLYDESIKLRRDINGLIHVYAEKTAESIGKPLDFYRHLCHNGNCALAYIAMIKKRKRYSEYEIMRNFAKERSGRVEVFTHCLSPCFFKQYNV